MLDFTVYFAETFMGESQKLIHVQITFQSQLGVISSLTLSGDIIGIFFMFSILSTDGVLLQLIHLTEFWYKWLNCTTVLCYFCSESNMLINCLC